MKAKKSLKKNKKLGSKKKKDVYRFGAYKKMSLLKASATTPVRD